MKCSKELEACERKAMQLLVLQSRKGPRSDSALREQRKKREDIVRKVPRKLFGFIIGLGSFILCVLEFFSLICQCVIWKDEPLSSAGMYRIFLSFRRIFSPVPVLSF